MNPPRPTGPLTGRKIFVGPNDIAGFASRIAGALAGNGAQVQFFNATALAYNPHVVESPNLRQLFPSAVVRASRWQASGGLSGLGGGILGGAIKFLAFLRMCVWAETCVMLGGKGFFLGGLEYAFLRLLGKRVIHVFVGTASRPRYLSGYARAALKGDGVKGKELQRLARRTRRQAGRIRGIARHASVVVENPLCGHFYEKPFVNFFKLGVPLDVAALEAHPRITTATPPRTEGKIRVLHCPSRPEIKGSARIQATVEKLIQEGLPLEFRQLTGVPRAQVLHEITLSDFVVDQLYSDSPLAGFAAEASGFGKAAVVGGYGWQLFREFLHPEEMPPSAWCHPDALEHSIRALAQNAAQRAASGAQSRAFLERHWSETAFAERFTRIVTGDIPPDWWFPPENVRYLHGMGLDEAETRKVIGALVEQHGPGALQVDHLPQLREQLVAFGKGQPSPY